MIQSKADYKYYLECDKVALRYSIKRPRPFTDEIWKFQRTMRLLEYWLNCKKGTRFGRMLLKQLYIYRGRKLGFAIPPNAFGPGLSIAHCGLIGINGSAKIGENCRIQTCVTIGATNGCKKSPQIGNNVFLGDGCKIIGDISIAEGVCIGANAVVVKDIVEPNTTWGGVPAKKISNNNSDSNIVKATEIVRKINE